MQPGVDIPTSVSLTPQAPMQRCKRQALATMPLFQYVHLCLTSAPMGQIEGFL